MGSYWTQLGQQVAGQAAQGAIGIGVQRIGANYDRKQQLKTQEKMMALQMRGMKEMSEFEQQQQLEMWKATGAPEQMKLLKEAGLNPALMYGGSGAGGQTVGHGGSSPGGGQAGYVDTTGVGMNLAMNMRLQEAQIKLMESQAKKTDVEAEVTGGVNKEKTIAETKDITQGIENKKVQEVLTQAQSKLTSIQANVAEQSQDAAIQKIQSEAFETIQTAHIAMNEAGISDATQKDKINILKTEAVGKVLENILKVTQNEEAKSRINKIAEDIAQGWEGLSIKMKEARVNAIMSEVKQRYEGGWGKYNIPHDAKAIARQIDEIMDLRKEDFKKK